MIYFKRENNQFILEQRWWDNKRHPIDIPRSFSMISEITHLQKGCK